MSFIAILAKVARGVGELWPILLSATVGGVQGSILYFQGIIICAVCYSDIMLYM